jgi:membrane fusion protein (multidrug efflux system)
MARRDLRETLITSPIHGILAERTVDIGTNVSLGTKVATVVEIDRVKIRVGVSEKEIAEIKEGLGVSVQTDAYPGKSYIGSVYSVGTKADDATLSFPVEIVVVNNQGAVLKPGMVARAAIKTGTYENAISLPQEAVMENEGRHFVWTVKADRAHKVLIIPIDLVGSDIILKDGLKPGQLVVVSGHERLFEGCRVQIIQE